MALCKLAQTTEETCWLLSMMVLDTLKIGDRSESVRHPDNRQYRV